MDANAAQHPGMARPEDERQHWLGGDPSLYRPDIQRPASEIEVARFRQILIWPLALQAAEETYGLCAKKPQLSAREILDDIRNGLSKTPWGPALEDPLEHAGAPLATMPEAKGGAADEKMMDEAQRYGEFVYFHDYVQRTLFQTRKDKRGAERWSPFTLHQRADIKRAEFDIVLHAWSKPSCVGQFRATVERCNLYLFDAGAAVLALEIDFGPNPQVFFPTAPPWDAQRPMLLSDVQTFADHARRAYTPFFGIPKVPAAVRWLDKDGVAPPDMRESPGAGETGFTPKSLCEDLEFIKAQRVAPVAAHWRALLKPLTFNGYHKDNTAVWRQVIDERIPVMSFVSLTGAAKSPEGTKAAQTQRNDLWTVKRGDWIRLCYADEAGGDPLPYSPAFVQNFEKDACYDRFFPSAATDTSTRYLIAGFHFAVVGAGEKFFDKIIVHHFRRHYFQIGLMLHMEFAALLATSSRITRAVSELAAADAKGDTKKEQAKREFRNTIIEVEQDFLQFQHLYHFTGMSNQIQARELFDKWRGALGTESIVTDLRAEIAAAAQFALSLEQREETSASTRLAAVATIGVVLGLAFSFLGMNFLMDKELLGLATATAVTPGAAASLIWKHIALVSGVVAVFSGGGLIVGAYLQPGKPKDDVRRLTRNVLWRIFLGTAALSLVTFLRSIRP